MADIFISPKKEDAGRVVRIVEALRAEGFLVWWDHGIAPGSQRDQTVQEELKAAKMVVAVWSEQSVSAPWVKEEAGVSKSRGVVLPVLIDDVSPPRASRSSRRRICGAGPETATIRTLLTSWAR